MAFKDVVPIILHVDSDPTFQQLIIVLEYIPVLNFELDFRISLQIDISKYHSVSASDPWTENLIPDPSLIFFRRKNE